MRHIPLASAPLLALVALAACNNKPETVNDTIGDPMEGELHNAAPVELPPALKASKTYRCKDNSLVYIDFMSDDKTANVKTEKEGPITVLKAVEAGQPYEAEGGFKVEGQGPTVTVTLPGKSALSCKG